MVRERLDELYRLLQEKEAEIPKVRKALADLKKECGEGTQALLYYLDEEKQQALLSALSYPDAKVRKNTALLLGTLGKKEYLPALFSAYEKEETLFARSAYLRAMMEYDFRDYMDALKKRKEALEQIEFTGENQSSKKHLDEEHHLLSEMLLMTEGRKKHEFRGYRLESDILLLTNRNHALVTKQELERRGIADGKVINAGVLVKTGEIEKTLSVRTYTEALFLLPFSRDEKKGILSANKIPGVTAGTISGKEKEAADAIVDAGLLTFLEKRHKGKAPFYFRMEWKGSLEPSKKGTVVKRLAAEIERCSKRQLVNSAGNYEAELRIIEDKSGFLHLMVKLYTAGDERFSYRKNSTADSIRPVNAALLAALAEPYLIDDARVLDPFCGTGAMLIERYYRKKTNTMYGVDLYGKAIEGARENTAAANQIIHYINRDFFEFQHEYLFDEVFTDMPAVRGKRKEQEIESLYRRFFKKIPLHLTEAGTLILYTRNLPFARKYAKENGFLLMKVLEISKAEESFLVIFKRREA